MTLALDPHFPCVSSGSTAPEQLPRAALVDELRRELRHRHIAYEKRVAKGRMSQMDADDEIECMAAMLADFECDLLEPFSQAQREAAARAAPMLQPFGWHGAVACLRREILLRRRYYPEWIRKGTLPAIDARHQLERLEAVHVHYWLYGRHFWSAPLGPWQPTCWTAPAWTPAQHAAWRDALHTHRARFVADPDNHRGHYRDAPGGDLP